MNDQGIPGGWSGIIDKVVRALPPAFLLLVILNVIFLGSMYWFVSARAVHTMSLLNQLLQECLRQRSG